MRADVRLSIHTTKIEPHWRPHPRSLHFETS
jgi:hypothetical protein